MIKHVIVRSRKDMRKMVADGTRFQLPDLSEPAWHYISVYGDPAHPFITQGRIPHLTKMGMLSHLSLLFTDCVPRTAWSVGNADQNSILFTRDQAKRVIRYMQAIKDANRPEAEILVVQCCAGISRSGAIGRFGQEFFETDPDEFNKLHPEIKPNTHVMITLHAQFYYPE